MNPQTMTAPKVAPHFAQKHFHVGLLSGPSSTLSAEFLERTLEAFCALGFSVSMVAAGTEDQQKTMFAASDKYLAQCQVLEYSPKNKKQIMEQSTVAVFWSQPDLSTLKQLSKEGIVVIMPYSSKIKGLSNFNAQKEIGNVFLYEEGNFWAFVGTVIRAFENFKFAYDWNNLKKVWMKSEIS